MKNLFRNILILLFTAINLLFFQNCSVGSSSSNIQNSQQNQNNSVNNFKIKLFSGSLGGSGYLDGKALNSFFNRPQSLAIDSLGNLYVSDAYNHVIRKISKDGIVSTIAGSVFGFANGLGINAKFKNPNGIYIDKSDNIFIADSGNNAIRKINLDGSVTTFSGGPATSIILNSPNKLVGDSLGNIYVIDASPIIKKILADGTVINFCGSGAYGQIDGICSTAAFNATPQGLAIDVSNNLYITESSNVIRKISFDGVVKTIAGTYVKPGYDNTGTGLFNQPKGLKVDSSGNIYVVDSGNNCIRKIAIDGKISTFSGNPNILNYADGSADQAQFRVPSDLIIDKDGTMYVADEWNYSIRKLSTNGDVTTLAGVTPSFGFTDGLLSQAHFFNPSEFIFDGVGNILLADSANNVIRKISNKGEVFTVAGRAGSAGSIDGIGTGALFSYPTSLAKDSKGNIYVTDRNSNTIRKISLDGSVTTIAGKAQIPSFADGPGVNARFNQPTSLVIDKSDNIYVADYFNHVIRKIDTSGIVTTFAGVAGGAGSIDGIGKNARLTNPSGLAITSSGNIIVACGDGVIRNITLDGMVTTIAGMSGFSGSDNGIGSKARFYFPNHVAVDSEENIYVADSGNSTIRMISSNGSVSTIIGTAGLKYNLLESIPSVILPARGVAVKNKTLYFSTDGGLLMVDLPN